MMPRKKHMADARMPFACHNGLERIGSTIWSTSSAWKKNKAAATTGLAVRRTPVASRIDHMDVNAAICAESNCTTRNETQKSAYGYPEMVCFMIPGP